MITQDQRRAMQRLRRGLRSQPWITRVAIGSAVVAITRQLLLPYHELWMYGAEFGDLLYDSSIAILTAWALNIAVVVMPRMREEELILAQIYPDLRSLANSALRIFAELSTNSGVPVPAVLSEAAVHELCAQVDTAKPPNMMVPGSTGLRQVTWPEYLRLMVMGDERRQERVRAHYARLPVELVELLQNIDDFGFSNMIGTLAATPMRNQNLVFLADRLFEHAERCDTLANYLRTQVQPLLSK